MVVVHEIYILRFFMYYMKLFSNKTRFSQIFLSVFFLKYAIDSIYSIQSAAPG